MAVWAGTIVGVSLISTPVKFQAPTLTMPVALEIGRYTFRLFANLELGFLVVILVAAAVVRPRRLTLFAIGAVAIQFMLQRFWLLPELDRGVSRILAGGPIVFSALHWLYAAFDVCKPVLLILAAVIECRSQLRWADKRHG